MRKFIVTVIIASLLATPAYANKGIWITSAELAALPTTGSAWNGVKAAADGTIGIPNLANQEDGVNVKVMAAALVFAKTRDEKYRAKVVSALNYVANMGTYSGEALALGRELGAYVIAADLIDLPTFNPTLDTAFKAKIKLLLTTPAGGGGVTNLTQCAELRPNNWGNHCAASRLAVALYLGDTAQVDRVSKTFKGYLGDRASYAGFKYGELSWQANASAPVGINPKGSVKSGHSIDGVLPDDQRRAGTFTWPPPKENYVYEGLQGALAEAIMLSHAGYDVWNWQDKALLRAFQWLHTQCNFPSSGDDVWEAWVVNSVYGTSFPATTPTQAGKNVGWTDWTHGSKVTPPPTTTTTLPPTTSTTAPPTTVTLDPCAQCVEQYCATQCAN